jgi:hypothetical protein
MHDGMIPHQHREARHAFPADASKQGRRLLSNDDLNDFYAGIFCEPMASLDLEITLVNTQYEMLLHYPCHSIFDRSDSRCDGCAQTPIRLSDQGYYPACGSLHSEEIHGTNYAATNLNAERQIQILHEGVSPPQKDCPL